MAIKKNKSSLLNYIMCINKAAIEDHCEDAYAYSFRGDYGMLAVFDGCGGLGAKKYSNCDNQTAAYISARIASHTVLNWFENQMPCNQMGMYASNKTVVQELKTALDADYAIAKQTLDTDNMRLIGSLIRSFPTTASIALVDGTKTDALNCTFLWAGDSRGYILQPDGLKQCTCDDLRINEDAFDNLYADSPLSNMVNGDGEYHINLQKVTCTVPAIIFAATDGTFGYLPSPMHYEWMIVKTLCQSRSFSEWEIKLRDEISAVTGDDSTIVMAVYGWRSYDELRKSFMQRNNMLTHMLNQNLPEDDLRSIWETYKVKYSVYTENTAEEQ